MLRAGASGQPTLRLHLEGLPPGVYYFSAEGRAAVRLVVAP